MRTRTCCVFSQLLCGAVKPMFHPVGATVRHSLANNPRPFSWNMRTSPMCFLSSMHRRHARVRRRRRLHTAELWNLHTYASSPMFSATLGTRAHTASALSVPHTVFLFRCLCSSPGSHNIAQTGPICLEQKFLGMHASENKDKNNMQRYHFFESVETFHTYLMIGLFRTSDLPIRKECAPHCLAAAMTSSTATPTDATWASR